MKNIGNIIKRLQNTMRKDQGVSGDAQRIEQLGWLISLKILDDKDQELEILQDGYVSPIPSQLQWRNWAADAEGMTGDELKNFIDQKLFPGLMNLDISSGNRRALIVREIFEGTNNYMKNGTIIRQVLNELNQIDFNSSEDRHIFGDIYETILRDLQSAGNYGEFYTPRALTEFMTETVNPRLGEKVLDPACGTGGFLTCAIENIRRQDVKNVDDLKRLQETIHGQEFKPLPFMLCVTNLILHDIEVPNVDYTDSLNREYTSIGARDRVDVILANPPFGASVTDGVETNFPLNYRTTESADLFLLLMIRYLKDDGRAAIVLPDGSLTGDGVKQRIRQHLLENCNLHTVVRLPNSVFQPYASVATNLLFFTKGKPTREIWYWEHRLPEGVKSYSKTKPIRKEEFEGLKAWWDNREEGEQAWRVSIDTLKGNGYNLDIKNPHVKDAGHTYLIVAEMDAKFGGYGFIGEELDGAIVSSHYYLYELDPAKIGKEYFLVLIHSGTIQSQIEAKGSTNYSSIRGWEFLDYEIPLPSLDIQAQIAARFNTCFSAVNNHDLQASEQLLLLKQLRQAVLQEAVEGKLTADWRTKNLPRLQGGNYDFLPPLQGEGRGGDGLKGDPRYDAAALLAQIKAEKERLVKAGKIRKEKPLPPIAESERPFELPAGWVWCRLGEVVELITKGSSPSWQGISYVEKEAGVLFVTSKNVGSYSLDLSSTTYVESKFNGIEPRSVLKYGDILTNIVGASIGRTAIYDRDEIANINQAVCLIRYSHELISKVYFMHWMNSDWMISKMHEDEFAPGRANLSMGNVALFPIPLPPLTEQQAIVARVDSLMVMIDELEQQVAERKEQAQMLMQAVLREAFEGGEGAEGDDVYVGAQHAAPVSAIPRRTRTRHASPLREPADKTRRAGLEPAPTEDLPFVAETSAAYKTRGQAALPAAKLPVPGGVPARILAAMHSGREYSRADLLAVTGTREADWIWAIRQLKEQGQVVQKGEKRGARYVRQ